MKKMLAILFLCTILFIHDKVSYASDDIIIDYIEAKLSLEFIEKNSFDSVFKNLVIKNITDPIVQCLGGSSRIVIIALISTLIILLFIVIIISKIMVEK